MPPTEKGERRHTSTITVAVLKESEFKAISLTEGDVEMQTCRSSGHGGQNVNKLSTAVRLTHRETGETVFCQDERKQGRNRKKALQRLERKLNKQKKAGHEKRVAAERKDQVGSGMRGDKIRTYNYRENRVTNHLTGKSVRRLREIVEQGRIDLVQ